MFEQLSQLDKKVEEMRLKIQKIAQDQIKPALKEAIREMRETIPTLRKIVWTQYRPYYNDGEACLFGVHGIYGIFEGHDIDPDDSGSLYDYELNYLPDDLGLTGEQDTMLVKFSGFLERLGQGEDSVLELAFGDSVQVLLDIKDGSVELEDFDHD